MPKVLVSGSGGQLGLELAELLPRRGHEVVALSKGELDVTDFGGVRLALEEHAPDVVVNAAAYTNVDARQRPTLLTASMRSVRGTWSRSVRS